MTSLRLNKTLTNGELRRVQEIQNKALSRVTWDRDEEGTLVVQLTVKAADRFGLYPHLYVLEDGRVAQATLNHPTYFRTFRDLLDAR